MTDGKLLAFGEVILRLSPPGRELLLQSSTLDVWVAGAEANVATQLAHLGHRVALATRLPDNDLGRAALRTLRGHGVDVGAVALGGERIGLYFVTPGAGLRATEVIYDRAGSAFAEAPAKTWDWDRLLGGVSRLHLSGITPALGPAPAAHAIAAAEAAAARGVPISFDGNWRGKLWARWDGDARALLTAIVQHVDVLFGDHRDAALLLGHAPSREEDETRPRAAAELLFAAFPRLRTVASTTRAITPGGHRLSARVTTRDGIGQAGPIEVTDIVDRIGSGDAFVAGVLHASAQNLSLEEIASTGLSLAALKHTLPGDAGLFSQADLKSFSVHHADVRR